MRSKSEINFIDLFTRWWTCAHSVAELGEKAFARLITNLPEGRVLHLRWFSLFVEHFSEMKTKFSEKPSMLPSESMPGDGVRRGAGLLLLSEIRGFVHCYRFVTALMDPDSWPMGLRTELVELASQEGEFWLAVQEARKEFRVLSELYDRRKLRVLSDGNLSIDLSSFPD